MSRQVIECAEVGFSVGRVDKANALIDGKWTPIEDVEFEMTFYSNGELDDCILKEFFFANDDDYVKLTDDEVAGLETDVDFDNIKVDEIEYRCCEYDHGYDD